MGHARDVKRERGRKTPKSIWGLRERWELMQSAGFAPRIPDRYRYGILYHQNVASGENSFCETLCLLKLQSGRTIYAENGTTFFKNGGFCSSVCYVGFSVSVPLSYIWNHKISARRQYRTITWKQDEQKMMNPGKNNSVKVPKEKLYIYIYMYKIRA